MDPDYERTGMVVLRVLGEGHSFPPTRSYLAIVRTCCDSYRCFRECFQGQAQYNWWCSETSGPPLNEWPLTVGDQVTPTEGPVKFSLLSCF